MDILNNKKNYPIVIAVIAVVIIGSIGSCVYFMGGGQSAARTPTSTAPLTPGQGGAPGPSAPNNNGPQPGVNGMPGPSQ